MLSSISSLLPSALADRLDKLDKLDVRRDPPPDAAAAPDAAAPSMPDAAKKEKKKKSTSNETFVVVRPPPAKSNHPLNLQLQLVPAQHTRDRSNTSTATTPTNARVSVDFPPGTDSAAQPPPSPAASEPDQPGAELQRTQSARSDRSDVSAFYASGASTASVASFASTASASSGRRMIIPLYNLHAHNVMTNTIHDAGTDAKVAKFHKRGLEIIDLAVLEPTEVWDGAPRRAAHERRASINRSASRISLAPPAQGGSRAGTPDPAQPSPGSSRLSLSSEHSSTAPPPPGPAAPPAALAPAGAKRIFGRMFRRREGSTGGGGGGGGHTPSASTASDMIVEPPPVPEVRAPAPEVRAPAAPAPVSALAPAGATLRADVLLPPVLGLSPTLTAAAHPPTGRCVAHVWTVRRWLKPDGAGLLAGVLGKLGREVSAHAPGHGGGAPPEGAAWEVRFEWARGRSKGARAQRHERTPSRRSSALLDAERTPRAPGESPRASLDAPRAAASEDGSTTGDDRGDESDPEDSETPWTCTLVLAPPPAAAAPPPDAVRLKVATLAPAPHHPKVVCQLKVAFPLPDAAVAAGALWRRRVLPDGATRSTLAPARAGPVLSAEEIKDVVCSTALWVAVRQGFGGLGKVRKGDGWKIRG